MSTEHLRHVFDLIAAEAKVNPFSAEFMWDPRHAELRFGAFLTENGRITVLEAVLRANLSKAERQSIFPTVLDLGRQEPLRPEQRTYGAIAKAVAEQLPDDLAVLDERYVKQTAERLGDLLGFPFSSYREQDPDLAARVLKLFVFLKRVYGPGVIGMLEPPGDGQRPSLELTNPFSRGGGIERRQRYAEVCAYVSAQLSPDCRATIDTVFRRLRPALGSFLSRVLNQIYNTPIMCNGHFPRPQDACRRLRQAAEVYAHRFAVSDEHKVPIFLPLDEQLYVHLLSLEFLHYAEFMRELRGRQLLRADIQPAVKVFQNSQVMTTYDELQTNPDAYMPLRRVVEYAFGETIGESQFRRAILRGSDVLRHYLQCRTLNPNATADFRLVTAALCFAMDLETGRVSDFKPHVHGQGNISGSVSGAMRDWVSARNEEFERICSESVDWYQAALIDQVEPHQACHNLLQVFDDLVVQACRSFDVRHLESMLAAFTEPGIDTVWRIDEESR